MLIQTTVNVIRPSFSCGIYESTNRIVEYKCSSDYLNRVHVFSLQAVSHIYWQLIRFLLIIYLY